MADTLLIRADADTRMGTGHLMRCFALARAWQASGGRAVFLSRCESQTLRERLAGIGLEFRALPASHPDPIDLDLAQAAIAESQGEGVTWIVVDGYHFDAGYQRSLQETGCRVLVVDDTGQERTVHADALLNQNAHATEIRYRCDASTRLLLGTDYALLRPEFLEWRDWKRSIPTVAGKLLVSLGGSDPDNATKKVLEALREIRRDSLDVLVVAGGANPHVEALREVIETLPGRVRLEQDIQDMPARMAWADVAVTAAGSTSWEICFMGLPSLMLALAENQTPIAEALAAGGAAKNLGWHAAASPAGLARAIGSLLEDAEGRQGLSGRGRLLVDGRGAERVVECLRAPRVDFRPARFADAELLWKWANDPEVRALSFNSDPIPWADHVAWLEARLQDPNCRLLIATNEADEPIGQVRFDLEAREAIVSIGLGRAFRNRGYGKPVIRDASERLFSETEATLIRAFIKTENRASLRVFEKAGYAPGGFSEVRGVPAVLMTLEKG